MPHRIRPVEDRFRGKVIVDEKTGCHNWQGTLSGGYGRLGVGSRSDGSRVTAKASRLAYEMANGPVPDGLHVLHRCDNTRCVNPQHLYAGTRSQNMKDAWAGGRQRKITIRDVATGRFAGGSEWRSPI